MSPRPSAVLLDEMLGAIATIERYTAGLDGRALFVVPESSCV